MADTNTDEGAVVMENVASMVTSRDISARMHEVVTTAAHDLEQRHLFGMPGYAKSKNHPFVTLRRLDRGLVTSGPTGKANIARDENAPDQLIESAWLLRDLDEPTGARIAGIARRAAG